ncbi:hypothetical protein EW146_g6732 [Bondarzewia mesenterica]|uniref:Aminodeoxychorismate lyase n=1 Tax=Bondarzewia mesenterica TaxID=1095465 RepID=A0A4S4LNE5_9AGAM|nr:hypothetical protein EW146_g6732 [Bondarzewia mesenterica]
MPDFELITVVRYDPALLDADWNTLENEGIPSKWMLHRFHHDRLVKAAAKEGWTDALATLPWDRFQRECERAVESYDGPGKGGCLKVRPVLSHTGTLSITIYPVDPLSTDATVLSLISQRTDALSSALTPIPIYLDTTPTPPALFTSIKTTQREHYAAARARLGLPPVGGDADVLLWSADGSVAETSLRNIAFFRKGRWRTPANGTGCLQGVFRRWLLEHNRISVDEVGLLTKDRVKDGEMVLVFNGVEGCRLGVIDLKRA